MTAEPNPPFSIDQYALGELVDATHKAMREANDSVSRWILHGTSPQLRELLIVDDELAARVSRAQAAWDAYRAAFDLWEDSQAPSVIPADLLPERTSSDSASSGQS